MLLNHSALLTVLLAVLVAGCAVDATTSATTSATPTGTLSAATASPAPATTMPSAAVPTVPPHPSPASLGGFTLAVPPDAATAWTGINWRKLVTDDPLAQVRSVVRWRGGFVAVGAPIATGATSATSRTPVWVSTDGADWRLLDTEVFGPATIVVGLGETVEGIVALTLQGGADQCQGQGTRPNCWMPAAPLQSWTSSNGTTWTAHAGPTGFGLPMPGCDECGVTIPIVRSGTPGLLVVNYSGTEAGAGSPAAFSRDGVGWENLPVDAFPAGISFHDVAGIRSGFIATGEQNVTVKGEETIRAVLLSSSDGRKWVERDLPAAPGLDPQNGSSAGGLVVGPDGLIAIGATSDMSGVETWWSSLTGRAWSRLVGYPPLGMDPNAEAGSRINGNLFGDGERMLAYRGGEKPAAWTSSDGRSWRTITVDGGGQIGADVLLPIGVLGTGPDGSIWFGTPLT